MSTPTCECRYCYAQVERSSARQIRTAPWSELEQFVCTDCDDDDPREQPTELEGEGYDCPKCLLCDSALGEGWECPSCGTV
jgi:predicted RNA-binding Zn-ribbon protein involved in translation (DUF1610 family)